MEQKLNLMSCSIADLKAAGLLGNIFVNPAEREMFANQVATKIYRDLFAAHLHIDGFERALETDNVDKAVECLTDDILECLYNIGGDEGTFD